jgi:hypothetical protein
MSSLFASLDALAGVQPADPPAPGGFGHYLDFRRSDDIEDRRNDPTLARRSGVTGRGTGGWFDGRYRTAKPDSANSSNPLARDLGMDQLRIPQDDQPM